MTDARVPDVAVLILNHNGRGHLEQCLPSLEAQTYPRDRYRVEVIDNGSSDGSVEFVRSRHPQVAVHTLARNEGFAGPYDRAVRASRSEYVALLNNDTRVDPAWLGGRRLTDPRLGRRTHRFRRRHGVVRRPCLAAGSRRARGSRLRGAP